MRAAILVLFATVAQAAPPPKVHVPPPEVGPSYPPALVERVLRRHRDELRRCLAFANLRRADVRVAFTVEADGRATHATADGAAGRCLAWQIAQLRFPTPPGGAILISMPLSL